MRCKTRARLELHSLGGRCKVSVGPSIEKGNPRGNPHKEVHVITRRMGRKIRQAVTRGFLGPVILAFIVAATPQLLSAQGDDRDEGRGFNHVFVIMMENTGFDTLIGNPKAPFINAAAANYGLASNYFGVTHPSQPNYIAATSGSTNGVAADNDTTIDVPNIVDQLEANRKDWKAYIESYSLCATPPDNSCV